ncbi:hypothetical protein F8568_043860 [Actinomadura sp. LD22]|uniref:Fibronectin type-III domain-containing protein n=1 Tax=Actinomadura physcomitrii TaxID=2650748 RepID=A0A6I4MQ70_9ACTN|nr:DUF6801 domain-containing protein [Actinomadura physcomitrii]MWA07160.1 hypothetical protein [Actinomadura physcomitrii]
MKPKNIARRVRTGTVLGSTAGLMLAMASIVAAPAASADASLTLKYRCTYPLIGQQDLSVAVSTDIPDKVALNTPSPTINIKAVSTVSGDTTFGLWTTLAKKLTGTAKAQAKLTAPQYPSGLPLKPNMTLADADVPDSGPFDITATGTQVPLTFNKAGWAQITVGNLDLTINPLGADGNPTGLGTLNASCKQLPGQNNVLKQFLIDDGSNPAQPEPKPDTYPAPNPVQTLEPGLPSSPEKTLDYTCPYPLVGDGDLQVKVKSNFPTEVPVNTATQDFISQAIEVTSVSTVPADVNENGLQQLGAVQMDGTALAHPTITVPEMANPVPLQMALKLDKTDVPATGPVSINGPGKAPALSFSKTGDGKVTLDDIDIQNFTTYDADGNPANLGDFTCHLKAGQDNTLFSFTIKDGGTPPPTDTTAPSVPANVKGAATGDSVALSWDASTDNDGGSGVKGYFVTVDGQKGDLVTGTSTTVSGLADGDHTFGVSAVDNAGNESAASAPVTVKISTGPGPDTTAPSAPANVKGTGSDDGSVALSWDASTDNDGGSGVKGYYVTVDGKKGDVVTGTSTKVTGLAAGDHTFAVSAVDGAGNESAASAPATVNVPGKPTGGGVSYALSGSSTIKGLNGKVALNGAVSATVDGSGKVSADLTLNPTTGTFSLFGFIPATAGVSFAPQGKTTGTLSGSTLSTDTKTVVKISSVKVFGMDLGVGNTCQTSAPADIPLKSTDFGVAGGGTLTGNYTLPGLTGCGALTPLVSALAAGPGNAIDLKAAPQK